MTSAARALPSPRAFSGRSRRGLGLGVRRNATLCRFGNTAARLAHARSRSPSGTTPSEPDCCQPESAEHQCRIGEGGSHPIAAPDMHGRVVDLTVHETAHHTPGQAPDADDANVVQGRLLSPDCTPRVRIALAHRDAVGRGASTPSLTPKISLPMHRRMNQRHVHLPAPTMMLAHVVLHDRVPAGEAVLVAETLENALHRVPLLAMVVVAIPAQPLVEESGESIGLRTAHRRGAVSIPAERRTEASSSRSGARPRNGAPPRARSSRPGTPNGPCDAAPRCESSRPPRDRKGPTHWQSFAPPRRGHPAATVV